MKDCNYEGYDPCVLLYEAVIPCQNIYQKQGFCSASLTFLTLFIIQTCMLAIWTMAMQNAIESANNRQNNKSVGIELSLRDDSDLCFPLTQTTSSAIEVDSLSRKCF